MTLSFFKSFREDFRSAASSCPQVALGVGARGGPSGGVCGMNPPAEGALVGGVLGSTSAPGGVAGIRVGALVGGVIGSMSGSPGRGLLSPLVKMYLGL